MRNTLKALALLACLLCAAEARADPLQITGGSITTGFVTGGPFTLSGDGFSLNGHLGWGPNACPACSAGQTVRIGFGAAGSAVSGIGAPPSTFGGVTYDHLYYSFAVMQTAGSLVMPDVTDAIFTVTAPFTFTAALAGCTNINSHMLGCRPEEVIFGRTDFVGSGTATVEVHSFAAGAGRTYQISSIRYDFASPTPEPATVALLATGLLGAGAAARRRRGKARPKETL